MNRELGAPCPPGHMEALSGSGVGLERRDLGTVLGSVLGSEASVQSHLRSPQSLGVAHVCLGAEAVAIGHFTPPSPHCLVNKPLTFQLTGSSKILCSASERNNLKGGWCKY